jgi:hypothetical protein
MVTALGFVALVTSNYLNSVQLDTGTFLRLWSATLLVLILGFVIILGGFLMASTGRMKKVVGGILGVLASFAAAFVTLILITTTVGINSYNIGSSAQLSLASEILFVGSILVLFVGFPLGMFGTVSAIAEREPEGETSEIPS